MGSKKKEKAPEYATTTFNTGGLFGSSTSGPMGVTYTPTSWQTQMGDLSSNLVNNSLQNMSSNDYLNDPNFKVYQDNFNKQMQSSFDASVLNPLTNRGLMRSSGLQGATNAFNDTMADNLTNLMDNYYNRQVTNLSSGLNAQNNLYNYLMGINTGAMNQSNSVSGYGLDKYKLENSSNNNLFQNLTNGISSIGTIANAVGKFKGSNGNN